MRISEQDIQRYERDLVRAIMIIQKLLFAPHEEQFRKVAQEFIKEYRNLRAPT